MSKLACIDLFCGAGGLTHGFISAGIPVVAGIDIDPACRYPYENNNNSQFIEKSVTEITSDEINKIFDNAKIRILAGCAPCQPFSTYSQKYDTIGTEKWRLLYEFARLVKGVLPEIVVMENVPTIGKHKVYRDFVWTLIEKGYYTWHGEVDASNYGLPQKRRRVILIASRIGRINLLDRTHKEPKTVRDAIGDIPPICAGESLPSDPLHTAANLSRINLERIRASRPGGTWRDWPERLVLECHRRDSGKTYSGVYGRMEWDEPSPTLTTQFYGFGNGRYGHPEQNRALSLREGAILQGFPIEYSFLPDGEPIRFSALGRMIGNAVPVTLSRVIAHSIIEEI